jgi:hypothetical protein
MQERIFEQCSTDPVTVRDTTDGFVPGEEFYFNTSQMNGLPRGETFRGLATNVPIPADAVTASGCGLDPHISLANAELQALRISFGE